MRILIGIKLYAAILLLNIGCSNQGAKEQNVKYIAINKRDTAILKLTLFEKHFYGKLTIIRPGNILDSGEVQGLKTKDTLKGNFFYRPHGDFNKKRRAFALLIQGDSLLQGNGSEIIYMGIPYYAEGTVHFREPEFTFHKKNR